MAQFGNPQQQRFQHYTQALGSASLATPPVGSHLTFASSDANLNLFALAPAAAAGGNNNNNANAAYSNGFGAMPGAASGLGNHVAQLGFAPNAAAQRHEASDSITSGPSDWKGMAKGRIRDVWRTNLAQEMAVIRSLIGKYPYVSMVCFGTR